MSSYRNIGTLALSVAAATLCASPVHAKRTAPRDVRPVTAKGVEYSAPHFASCRERLTSCYTIRATQITDRRVLWQCDVYFVDYDPFLEQDVQDVFISKLEVENDLLLVENERRERFTLSVQTGVVSLVQKHEGSRTRIRGKPCAIPEPP